MKILLILLLLHTNSLFSQRSVYELKVASADDKTTSLAEFKGRKILVASASPEMLQKEGMLFLDSLQAAYPKLQVIVLPATDLGGENADPIKESEQSNESKGSLIAAPSKVSKKGEGTQNEVMKWLTAVEGNSHFGADVNTDFQLYVISESGILYAVLEKGTDAKTIDEILNQEDVKE